MTGVLLGLLLFAAPAASSSTSIPPAGVKAAKAFFVGVNLGDGNRACVWFDGHYQLRFEKAQKAPCSFVFGGGRYSDGDRVVQDDLENAYRAAYADAVDNPLSHYATGSKLAKTLAFDEPELRVSVGGRAELAQQPPQTILVDPLSSPTRLLLWARSKTGTTFRLSAKTANVPELAPFATSPPQLHFSMSAGKLVVRASGFADVSLGKAKATFAHTASGWRVVAFAWMP
jgi:hypothetical protein